MQNVRANGVRNFNLNDKTHIVDPRNLLAMNMVRCMNCQKYFKLDQIHLHLRTHQLNRRYEHEGYPPADMSLGYPPSNTSQHLPIQKPFIKSQVKPINLASDVRGGEPIGIVYPPSSDRIQYDIRTMAPAQLPQPDNLRKKMPVPEPGVIPDDTDSKIGSRPASTLPDDLLRPDDIPDVHGYEPTGSQPIGIEQLPKEQYFDRVVLKGKTKAELSSKPVQLFSNQNSVDRDDHVDKKKNLAEKDKGTAQKVWSVQRINRTQSKSGQPGEPGIPDPNTARKVFIVEDKNVADNEEGPVHISTRNRQSRRVDPTGRPRADSEVGRHPRDQPSSSWIPGWLRWTCGGLRRPQSPELNQTEQGHDHGRPDFACPACGGFFCPVCKSTIPPKFRPPPGIKEYLEHSRSTHFMMTPPRHE